MLSERGLPGEKRYSVFNARFNGFCRVGGTSIYDSSHRSRRSSGTVTDAGGAPKDLIGLALVMHQVRALFRKKALYTSRNLLAIFWKVGFASVRA